MKKFLFLGFALLLFSANSTASPNLDTPPFHGNKANAHIQELNTNFQLLQYVKDDIEGYSETVYGTEFYSYPSIREDINTALISRATTGKLGISFMTGIVPKNHSTKDVTFTMLSDLDLNLHKNFDVLVNDQPLLTFRSTKEGKLEITDNKGNGSAQYILVKRDLNGDGIGVLRLTVPTRTIQKGQKAKITIVGQEKNSNCWIMIFKGDDTVNRIKISVSDELAYNIKSVNGVLHVDAPAFFEGRKVYIISDGNTTSKKTFKAQGELAKATFEVLPPRKSFSIICNGIPITLTFKNGDGILTDTTLQGSYIFHNQTSYDNAWYASLAKLYKPEFLASFDDFFESKYENGSVSIMNSSHQDIAWVDRPEIAILLRDTLLLTPVLNDAFERNDYAFDIENGLMLREYLDRHPDAQEKITTLLNRKLISVGATYNCPYEDMYDSEDQVRQLYLGKKWVKKMFGGYDSKVYWNVDVPGKSLQTPQILKKAGVDHMVISRHAKGLFNWASPDGSAVFTYSPGHYGYDLIHLSRDINSKMKYGADEVKFWEDTFTDSEIQTPLLSSQDMLPAIDYSDFITRWNGFESLKGNDGKSRNVFLPEMELRTVDEFMPMAKKNIAKVETIMGERPNVWVYIHGPGHHDAITASRKASKLLPAAEKFWSVANILDPYKMPYPHKTFDNAWLAKIYPDHGWGGHDGDITDNLFKENLVKSQVIGEDLLEKSVQFLARRIKYDKKNGIPIVLFNSLSWQRTDPVTIDINLVQGQIKNLGIVDASGNRVNVQTNNETYHKDGSLQSAQATFIASDIPSMGYSTYYGVESTTTKFHNTASTSSYENPHYKVTFGDGGISGVYDKQLNKDLFTNNGFMVGDVYTMESIGNGAGEFGDIQQPTLNEFDQVGKHKAKWKILENGAVYTKYRLEQPILHAIARQDITLYHDLKRIYFDTELRNWSGELYREFRTAFPLDMENPEISYEVPFGSVRIGEDEIETAGDRYTALCKDVHPRAILDWMKADDGDVTITLSSSVAAIDWIDPTNHNGRPLLQHLLLASRTSCHWEGNEYSQGGNHSFDYVLTSTKSGNENGQQVAKQKNEPIKAVINPDIIKERFLPEHSSFFNPNNKETIVSTIKKAEDTEEFIVRMYNTTGENNKVELTSFFKINAYNKTNIIEEYPKPIDASLEVGPYAIETFSLDIENK